MKKVAQASGPYYNNDRFEPVTSTGSYLSITSDGYSSVAW